jgi:hypothetical protein
MWEQIKLSFEDSLRRVATAIAGFLPRLLALAAILLLALILAVVVRALIRRLLAGLGFDERLRRWGLVLATDGSTPRLGLLVARIAFWLVLLAGFLLGLTVFDATVASTLAFQALGYLPQVLAAAVIFAVGVVVARFLERSVLISAVNMQINSARLLSLGVKWLVTILATAMALQHLGIGGSLVTISFSILFGGIVLALALAVGLGSREMVSKTLEKQIRKEKQRKHEVEDEVRHL